MTFNLTQHIYQRDNIWFEKFRQQSEGFSVYNPWGNTPVISWNATVINLPHTREEELEFMLSLTADLIKDAATQGKVPGYLLSHVSAIYDTLNDEEA